MHQKGYRIILYCVVFKTECRIINIINHSDGRKILTKSVIALKRVTCEKEKANERNEIDE